MKHTKTMKAAIAPKYGPPEVIQIIQTTRPIPRVNEICVKVVASALNSSDSRVRGLRVKGVLRIIMRLVLGLNGPRKQILGSVFSGEVIAVGSQVTKFSKGDLVFGITGMKFGTHAEFLCIRENGIVIHKPKNATHLQAASLPFGALTAKYFIGKYAKDGSNNNILVYGASGAVGAAAVQIAKIMGMQVTAVCSTKNMNLVKSLGADTVIGYDITDFMEMPQKFSLIFDAVGKLTKKQGKKMLNENGKFFSVEGLDVAKERLSDLQEICKLYEEEKFVAVIDQSFSIDDIVAAHRYVDSGRKIGNVLITIN